MEHRDQLPAGELPGVGEEAAREDLQRQVPGAVGEAQPVQHVGGAAPVEGGERLGEGDVEQAERLGHVHAGQVARRERGGAEHEAHHAPRRCAWDVGEGVAHALGREQRVVPHGPQRGQRRVGAAQQRAQVVVLPEEGVEAAAHRHRRAVDLDLPRRHAAAEAGGGLQQLDPHAALGQGGRGREAGDPATDDGDAVPPAVLAQAGRRSGLVLGAPVAPRAPGAAREPAAGGVRRGKGGEEGAHRGFLARHVCTWPRCQPVAERCSTSVNPTARSRPARPWTPSKSRTLRHR